MGMLLRQYHEQPDEAEQPKAKRKRKAKTDAPTEAPPAPEVQAEESHEDPEGE